MSKKYFITFEGIDGAGKDTQLNVLQERIRNNDNIPFGDKYSTIWITREPTKITNAGKKICELLKGDTLSAQDATNLFIQDRIEHSRHIEKILYHSHVLSSRYDLTTLTYQMTQGMDFEELYKRHKYSEPDGALIPDLTIVFDIPVDVAMKRMNLRDSSREYFETQEFQEKLRENLFYSINRLKQEGRNIIIVNGDQPLERVSEEMITKIQEALKNS